MAWKSGNVFVRDIIIEVNGHSVEHCKHDDVIDLIQEDDPVEFLLQTTAEDMEFGPDMSRAKDVTLKRDGGPLGLVVVEHAVDGGAVRVVGKMPGTIAAKVHDVVVGDQIVAVNGKNVVYETQEVVTEAIRDAGDMVQLCLVPNPDPYIRDVEVSGSRGFVTVETVPLHGGTHEHRVVSLQSAPVGPNFWWDLHNTLVYRGDTIESVGDEDARFLDHDELLAKIESGASNVILVMRTDFSLLNEQGNGVGPHEESQA